VCLFTEWSRLTGSSQTGGPYYDGVGLFGNPNEDCYYWCVPTDINFPTECEKSGLVLIDGEPICSTGIRDPKFEGTHYSTNVHAPNIGRDVSENSFQLITIFTGGEVYGDDDIMEIGYSHMEEAIVSYEPEWDAPRFSESKDFGSQLWQDTVELPYDVGVDHSWVDDTKDYLWISAYREQGNGLHMVDLRTGDLVLSLKNFENLPHDPELYAYNAGNDGYGTVGQKGAFCLTVGSVGKPIIRDGLFARDGWVSYVPIDNLPGWDEYTQSRN